MCSPGGAPGQVGKTLCWITGLNLCYNYNKIITLSYKIILYFILKVYLLNDNDEGNRITFKMIFSTPVQSPAHFQFYP